VWLAERNRKMPVRKVVTRTGRGYRGYYPSKKVKKMVSYESILEREAIEWIETHPEVISYEEQPTITHYYDKQGEARKYYPDCELSLITEISVHVEVKQASRIAQKNISLKYQSISETYKNRSQNFIVLTELEIKAIPKKSIIEIIAKFNLEGVAI
jgi:hypothetical protein